MKIEKGRITSDRILSDLDDFAVPFASLIEKHAKYVFVSGYVSIVLGRSRVSEDVDMLIPEMEEGRWIDIYDDLLKHGYYCMNAGSSEESYSLIKNNTGVRFAREGQVVPNMEIQFVVKKVQKVALETSIELVIRGNRIFISDLELQIAYKEKVLKSNKDAEDAMHLRKLLGKDINLGKLIEYEELVKDETR